MGCQDDGSSPRIPEGRKNPGHPVHTGKPGCQSCHESVTSDPNHVFPCETCHLGNSAGHELKEAHAGLIAHPAHPDYLANTCGRCHPREVADCKSSLHFTLQNEVNLVRRHFGAGSDLYSLIQIPEAASLTTPLELGDDLLRRHCLRCHPYTRGDDYPATARGTGCAACHMAFRNGRPLSHTIIGIPGDDQCLACHYANHVGADYYGRFDHDFHDDFRTPIVTREAPPTPYGLEFHQLNPDVHQRRGLSCVDCHPSGQLMGHSPGPACATCHDPLAASTRDLPANVLRQNSALILVTRHTSQRINIPLASHPAHSRYRNQVDCQVCHAQWSFLDSGTHLLRSESDDYDDWLYLTSQGNSAVEQFLTRNLFGGTEELPSQHDMITGRMLPGIWYMGFGQRRWEKIVVRQDNDGIIKVFRPVLDLHLSAIDNEGNLILDNIQGNLEAWRPYTPHTTGPAGIFYYQRLADLPNFESTEAKPGKPKADKKEAR